MPRRSCSPRWKGWHFDGNMLADTTIAVGDFDTSPLSPCAEIVFAKAGDGVVRIVPTCQWYQAAGDGSKWVWNLQTSTSDPWQFAAPARIVHLANSATIGLNDGGGIPDAVRVVDLNDDDCLDLVVAEVTGIFAENSGSANGEILQSFVAYGNCDGTFHSPGTAPGTKDNIASAPIEQFWGQGNAEFPLAIGRLNAGPDVDLVYSSYIVMTEAGPSQNGGGPPFSFYSFGAQWSAARIADVNRDGWLDVVALSATTPELHYLQGAPGGAFAPFAVALGGLGKSPTLGDFDGDGLLDVAFGEAPQQLGSGQSDTTASGDALSVVFGNAHGAPSDPVTMGSFDNIEWISAGNIRTAGFVDALDDVAVGLRFDQSSGGKPGMAVLPGSTDRQLMAPFYFKHDVLSTTNDVPLSVSVGDFSADSAGHGDVAVITTTAEASQTCSWDPAAPPSAAELLWLIPSKAEASFALASAKQTILSDANATLPVGWRFAAMAKLDVGDPPGDELVVLAPTVASDSLALAGALAVYSAQPDPSDATTKKWALAALDHGATGQVSRVEETFLRVRGRCPTNASSPTPGNPPPNDPGGNLDNNVYWDTQLQVVDVDGDGREDLAALGFVPGSPAPATGFGAPVITVFLNEGRGALDPDRRVVVHMISSVVVRSFAFLDIDADGVKELAVGTDDGILMLEVALNTKSTPPTAIIVDASPLPDPSATGLGTLQLVAADFNGDGVADLAETRTLDGAVLVRLGVPLNP